MSNRTYGPCACGDRCSLKGVQADSQHKCPWCEGLLHGLCGEASAQYGPHADEGKDLTGLKWGRVCFNCAEKRKAELAGSGTARVTGQAPTADRTSATSLIASRRPALAEQAAARAAERQRNLARRRQRERENDEAETHFASHEIPGPRNPDDEAAIAASFALPAPTNHGHRGYGPSSRMDTTAAIHVNQQRRDAARAAPRAAAASDAPPPAVAATATTGGGGMLVEPACGLIPDAGMHAGVQGPSMRLVADAMYRQRLQHEENRPKRTQDTCGTFFENYWKPFCDAKDGGEIDGVTISGKGNDKWDYLVTPDKACLFMSLHSLKRAKRKAGGGTRSKKSVRNDLAKIVDLHQKQKVTPEYMAVMSRVGHPRKDNELLKQLLASHDYGEKERRDEAILEESGVSLCDGEYYTRDQHRQVLSHGLLKEGGNPTAVRHSEIELAKLRLHHVCGHNYLIRSEGRAVIRLRDLHMLEGPEGEGDQPMNIVVAHQDRSKTNQTGNLKRHGAARHRNEPWRPKRPGLPPFAANYEFLQHTSIKDLVEEYLIRSRGRPALKDIEKYFGPKKRGKSGKFPSWRSRSLRGSKKYDKRFCLNKNMCDLIDESKTIDQTVGQFEQIAHDNNPEMMQGNNPTNGKLVQWLIKYLQQNKEGYNERRGRANAGHVTKKRKREEQQQLLEDGGE